MSFSGKILLATNQFLIQEGLRSVLSKFGFEEVYAVDSQDLLERTIVKIKPDFVFIQDGGTDFNIEKTIAFLSITNPANTVVISDIIKKEKAELFLKVGVRGLIDSNISELELREAFQKIEVNESFVSPKIKKVLSYDEKEAFRNTCAELNISEREVEIIKLIAEGYINKEIADRLFLSTHTVNTHRKNIMNKLGVSNASGVVIFAVKEKLVSPKEFLFSSKH